jgi:glycosyltransferase involved in cell wall biosynthesis
VNEIGDLDMKKKMLYLAVYDISVPGMGRTLRGTEMVNFFAQRYELHLVNFQEKIEGEGLVGKRNTLRNVSSKTQVKFSKFGHFVFSASLLRAAERVMKSTKFDIILTDYGTAAIYGYLLSKKYGVPWIYCSHQIEYRRFFDFAKDDFRRYLFVPYLYVVERLGCIADLVVAISEDDARVFSKWIGSDRLLVTPQGFDEEVYHPYYHQPSADLQIVLFFGNYNYAPNREAVDIIYREILPQVIQRIPKTLFQFVGPHPPNDIIHPNIEFTGFVDSLADYICRANVIIVPILQGGGMRTKIIESLACGKTVISTPIGAGGIPTNFSNLIIRDVKEFPDEICKTIEDGKMVDSSNYDILREQFAWQSILTKLDRKIDKIILD